MIIKCPNCGSALHFDEKTKKLVCDYCDSTFDPETIQHSSKRMEKMSQEDIIASGMDDPDSYMGLNVYTCSSCGGQIRVNGVEASTFCSFCGQPTVIFDRVEKSKKPDYILPFTFPKERVEGAVRDTLNKGFFVPKEIKAFKTECIRGIYVPFWLMDVDYSAKSVIRGEHKTKNSTITSYYYRKGSIAFKRITLDASRQLADESSQRLEPFDLSKIQRFNMNYLTGFYADSMDVHGKAIDDLALSRSKDMYDKAIIETVRDSNKEIYRERVNAQIVDRKYAMLPVWFLSFHHNTQPYTYLVNGQTGKVIGAVSYDKRRVQVLVAVLSVIFAFIGIFLMNGFYMICDDDEKIKALIIGIGAAVVLCITGLGFRSNVQENMALSQSESMFNLVKKRQENH